MDQVSRPLLGLLAAVLAVFALYYVALKPSSSNSNGSAASGPSSSQLSSAVNKAHAAVAASNAASVAHGGTVSGVTTPARTAAPAVTATKSTITTAHTSRSTTRVTLSGTPQQRLSAVESALKAKKTVALLFYNPAAADDRAVKSELASIPGHGGKVYSLAVPVDELSKYSIVTQQVPITQTPTLVLISRNGHAATIIGFADRFEIAQRVTDALSVH